MFVKVQEPTFAEALNISNFDTLFVHRVESGYALSVAKLPYSGPNELYTIATFQNEKNAIFVFTEIMNAIENGEKCWSWD